VLATKASSPQKREAYFKEGMRFGKQAVKNNQNSSYAHSWLALMIGSSAMDEGVVKTLYNKEIIRSGFETAITLNPENTNAHAGLAGWYFHVPGLFGGNKQKAFQLIERAIELEPDYTAPQIMKAEFLIAEHNYPEAIRTLKGVLAVKQPVIRGDGVEDKLKAENMLRYLTVTQK
jgi:tetratricopeptide (TPR) repeat protein